MKNKHFVAIAEDRTGREGLSIVDAATPAIAIDKMRTVGLDPVTVPKPHPLKFKGGVAVTKVHDDGDISAHVKGKDYVITEGGAKAYKEIGEDEKERMKAVLIQRMHSVKENLERHPGKIMHRAAAGKAAAKPEKMGAMHMTKNGGITRRRVK
jgi:hypothetical protein